MSNENSQKFKIGCHLSASKGFLNMGKEIVALGGNTFQFFTRNPRGFAVKPFDEEEAVQQKILTKRMLKHLKSLRMRTELKLFLHMHRIH